MNSRDAKLEDLRSAVVDDPDVPERVRGFLSGGAALDDITLGADGRWRHEGVPFSHSRLAKLFHRSLSQTAAGTWILTIPPYTYPVSVERWGHFVQAITSSAPGDGRKDLTATFADGSKEPLDTATLATDGDEVITAEFARGQARLIDAAYRTVTANLDHDGAGYTVEIFGQRRPLRPLPPPT